MRLTSRTRCALRILLELASLNKDDSPHSIGSLARAQDESETFVSQIAVPLRRASIISSVRGSNGGIRLARQPAEITLLDIIEAVEGRQSLLKCLDDPKSCDRKELCATRRALTDLNDRFRALFASVNLTTFSERPCAESGDPCCI